MKSFIFTILLYLKVFNVFCQDTIAINYFNESNVCIAMGVGNYTSLYFNGYEYVVKNKELTFNIETGNGIQIKKHQIGLLLGVDKWKGSLLFPLGVLYKIGFTKKKHIPYFELSSGYAFGNKNKSEYDGVEKGSYYFKGGSGFQFKLSKDFAIKIGLYYKMQNMRSSYSRIINPNESKIAIGYNIPYHFIGLSIGMKI